MTASPQSLTSFLRIRILDQPFFHASANQVAHIIKTLESRSSFPCLRPPLALIRGCLQHKSNDVVVGVIKSKMDVRFHPLFEYFERIALHLAKRCQPILV